MKLNSGLVVDLGKMILLIITSALILPALCLAEADHEVAYQDHIQCQQGEACKIDLYLTKGLRAFSQCQVCHGLDANGSSFAPSLVEQLKEIDKALFVARVTMGYKGQIGVMPAWQGNPNVMKYIDNLYDFLKARSDGAIPGGKLKRYDR